jgi:mevalonate kinase
VAILRAFGEHSRDPFRPTGSPNWPSGREDPSRHASGIDNTVIAYEQPVYFVRAGPSRCFGFAPSPLVVDRPAADGGGGQPSGGWQPAPALRPFDKRAACEAGRRAIEAGEIEALGTLMNRNQTILEALALVTPTLRNMHSAAEAAGALGAKISGAGLGGNLIALIRPEDSDRIAQALVAGGARRVILTEVR